METKSLIDYGREISAREAMREPALDGEQTLLMLLGLTGVAVWSVLHGAGTLRWDRRMHGLFGLASETFSGRQEDFLACIHPGDRDRVRLQFFEALDRGGRFATEYRVVWPSDGSVHILRSKGQTCDGEAGGACRMAGICWDVTESKEKEQALAWERHLMGFLMENCPDKIYFKDVSGRFIRINKAMREWFGEEEDEGVIGKTDFGFFTEEHARTAFEDEHTVINTGVPVVHKEERETCRDGRTTWVSTSKMPLRDPEGRIIGTFGISIDITRQKRVEARFLEQLERLRMRNAELEEALKRAS
jgi:PAS domain S-box-containing protein